MSIQQVTFNCEVATPMFLGGANQREPELRPASIRGALRYWLRAALGGVIGDNNLATLHRLEAQVFGETDRGSAVWVKMRGDLEEMMEYDLDRDKKGKQTRSGHNYFYYSTRLGDNRRVPFAARQAGLTLILATRPGAVNADDALRKAAASAWLLTHLGGLGMRARRCAGSVQVVQGSIPGLPDFVISAQTPQDLQRHLEVGLQQVCAAMGTWQRPSKAFDVLHPDVCRVWVVAGDSPWQTWKDAVDAIGSALQCFRAGQGANRNTINSIFGVPILHGPNHGLQRRASPLHLRITKLASGVHVGVTTLFKADFKDGTVEVGGGYALIEQFVQSFPTCPEVNY